MADTDGGRVLRDAVAAFLAGLLILVLLALLLRWGLALSACLSHTVALVLASGAAGRMVPRRAAAIGLLLAVLAGIVWDRVEGFPLGDLAHGALWVYVAPVFLAVASALLGARLAPDEGLDQDDTLQAGGGADGQ